MHHRLFENGWNLRDNLLGTFNDLEYWLTPDTRILVYGTGDGSLVYDLRDLGFDAYGYDTKKLFEFRNPEDRRFFRFGLGPHTKKLPLNRFRNIVRLPFPDEAFDVVVSMGVVEHSPDLSLLMSEVARVLRASGFALHLYPKRSTLVEGQTYVPLATRLRGKAYLYFWALLGLRNEFQKDLSAWETARANYHYLRGGIHYYPDNELYAASALYFENVKFVQDSFYYNAHPLGIWAARLRALVQRHPLRALAGTQKMGALFTAKKRPPDWSEDEASDSAAAPLHPDESARVDREPLEVDLRASTLPITGDVLQAAGFAEVGAWLVSGEGKLRLSGTFPPGPGLYAFLLENELAYVGFAQASVGERLAEYEDGLQAPKRSYISALIREALDQGRSVKALAAMPDPLEWGGLPVDTAAGMEAGLVSRARPLWNVLASANE
jgi:SAM-dependent methyltransferase